MLLRKSARILRKSEFSYVKSVNCSFKKKKKKQFAGILKIFIHSISFS